MHDPKEPTEIQENDLPPTGLELIIAERERQITQEGWSKERDAAEHQNGELAMAAACYAFDAVALPTIDAKRFVFDNWPWSRKWWKPTPDDPIRQLTKAGALIAAEIDRRQGEHNKRWPDAR